MIHLDLNSISRLRLLSNRLYIVVNVKGTYWYLDDLKKWSPHSIRVGAAVRLHFSVKDGPHTQIWLRWRSLDFMVYLRNTIEIVDQQHVY